LMDTFHMMKESVFHAENEEPVPCPESRAKPAGQRLPVPTGWRFGQVTHRIKRRKGLADIKCIPQTGLRHPTGSPHPACVLLYTNASLTPTASSAP